jgi:microcystin degradation protein MlrC
LNMRRIAVGGIVHETNTFSPNLTDLDFFACLALDEGPALVERWQESKSSMGGALQGLKRAQYEAVPLLYATAMPSGLVTRYAYQTLLTRLLDRLDTALPVDGVLLVLHGAMVAEGQDDCEGEILEAVRARVGVTCPVVSVLDMHGSLTRAMVNAADLLVAFDKNPHTDTFERGLEAAELLRRLLDEGLEYAKALTSPPLLLSALTTATARLPLRAMHEQAEIFRQDPSVVNVSIMGGFAYSDIPTAGVSALVTTTGDQALAQQMAQTLADIAWQHRGAARYTGISVDDAVKRAINASRGPVVLADIGDNVGGGSPGDGTVLLQALIDANAQDAAVVLADAAAVQMAVDAGVGAPITMLVGGKQDQWHGAPVQIHGTIEALTDGCFSVAGTDHFANIYGTEVNMGRCARLRCEGIDVLLTERKTPPGDLAQLRSQGIVPEDKKIIVVKSPVAFRAAYEPIAAEIFEVDTPGICAASLNQFTYRKLRRPIFPLDDIGSVSPGA